MSLISILDTLLAAGASAQMIVDVVKADYAERDARENEHREKDARRKREERLTAKLSSTDIHGHPQTAQDTADGAGHGGRVPCVCDITAPAHALIVTLPSEEISNITPSETTSPRPPRGARSARGCRLPDDWEPSDSLIKFTISQGFSPEEMKSAVDGFKDFWRGVPGARGNKLDWDGTFRNRIRDLAPKVAGKFGKPRQSQFTKAPGGLAQAMMDLQRKIENDGIPKIGSSQNVLRLPGNDCEEPRGRFDVGELISGSVKRV